MKFHLYLFWFNIHALDVYFFIWLDNRLQKNYLQLKVLSCFDALDKIETTNELIKLASLTTCSKFSSGNIFLRHS